MFGYKFRNRNLYCELSVGCAGVGCALDHELKIDHELNSFALLLMMMFP